VPFILKWDRFGIKVHRVHKIDHKEAEKAVGGNLYKVSDYTYMDWQKWLKEESQNPNFRGIHIYPNLRTLTAKNIKAVSGLEEKATYLTLTSYSAKSFNAIWFECDDISKEDQIALIARLESDLGLTPSLIIDTKGKSFHTYYKSSEPIDKETWDKLQRALIALCKSDPNLFRVSGSMRLAGSPRRKDEELVTTEIIYTSDAVYTPTELLEKLAPWLPKLVEKKPLVAQRHYSTNQDLTFTPGQAIDLELFLPDNVRSLLNGVADGNGRHEKGKTLTAIAFSIEKLLEAENIPFTGSAADLIEIFCHNSDYDANKIKDLCRFGEKINPDFSYRDRLIYIYKKHTGQLPNFTKQSYSGAIDSDPLDNNSGETSSNINSEFSHNYHDKFNYDQSYIEAVLAEQKAQEEANNADYEYEKLRSNARINPLTKAVRRAKKLAAKLKNNFRSPKVNNQEGWVNYTRIKDNSSDLPTQIEFEEGQYINLLNQGINNDYVMIDTSETSDGKNHRQAKLNVTKFPGFYQKKRQQWIEKKEAEIASRNSDNTEAKTNSSQQELVPPIFGFHLHTQTGNSTIEEINNRYEKFPTRNGLNCHLTDSHNAFRQIPNHLEFNPICHACKYWKPPLDRKDGNWCGGPNRTGTQEQPEGYLYENLQFIKNLPQETRSAFLAHPLLEDAQSVRIAFLDEITALLKLKKYEIKLEDLTRLYYALRNILEAIDTAPEDVKEIILLYQESIANTEKKIKQLISELEALKASKKEANKFHETRAQIADLEAKIIELQEFQQKMSSRLKEKTKKLKTPTVDKNLITTELKDQALTFIHKLFVDGLIKLANNPDKNEPYHGYNLIDLKNIFSELSNLGTPEVLKLLTETEENFRDKNSQLPQNPSPKDIEEKLVKYWFPLFLDKIFTAKPTLASFKLQRGILTLCKVDEGLNKLTYYGAIIGLDASAWLLKEDLLTTLECLGYSRDKVIFIRKKITQKTNLKITQFLDAKLETKKRGEKAQEKVAALRIHYQEKYSSDSLVFADHKAYCQEEDIILQSTDTLRGSRGSNTFYASGKSLIVQTGTPRPNIGDLAMTYEALNITGITQEEHLSRHVADQQIQLLGRTRAQRQLDRHLEAHLYTDENLDYLTEFGYQPVTKKDFNIAFPHLGTSTHKILAVIAQEIIKLDGMIAPTIEEVAQKCARAKSTISESLKTVGLGFRALIEKFGSVIKGLLVDPNYSSSDNVGDLISSAIEKLYYDDEALSSDLTETLTDKEIPPPEKIPRTLASLIIALRHYRSEIASWLRNDYPDDDFPLYEESDPPPSG